MSDDTQRVVSRKVCTSCGRVHTGEEDVHKEPFENLKIAGFAVVGILLVAILWFWVFQFGVPLVKSINGLK